MALEQRHGPQYRSRVEFACLLCFFHFFLFILEGVFLSSFLFLPVLGCAWSF